MANFYLDNSDLKHHLNHPLMKKLVALRERNYSDAEKYDYAPFNFEDAMDSYEKVLEIAGEISGEIVAANAEDVDHEGPHVVDGHVVYAKGTQKNLDALVKAGLMGTFFFCIGHDDNSFRNPIIKIIPRCHSQRKGRRARIGKCAELWLTSCARLFPFTCILLF